MAEAQGLTAEQKKGVIKTIAGVAAFIALIIAIFIHGLNKDRVMTVNDMKNNGAFVFDKARSFKPFALVDAYNQPFTPAVLQDKWSLIFFGFTYCPDICPTTLAQLKRFYEKQSAGKFGKDLQIILVSVDPARDTPEKLRQYIEYFHQDFKAVTGDFLDIHRFATQLNIPFSKVPGGGDNYTVEHSGNVAIINPRGHYVGFFRAPLELPKMNMTYKSIRLINKNL